MKESEMQYWEQSQINRMISIHFQVQAFSITVIQVYVLITNAKEAEQFYKDLQDLELIWKKKDVLFIIETGMQK